VAQVKEIAAARARENGFVVTAAEPWTLALQIRAEGNVWVAQLMNSSGPSPYWLHIADATGKAEFVMPMVVAEQKRVEGADWLFKLDEALGKLSLPLKMEDVLRAVDLTGVASGMGGRAVDGRFFEDYTLRVDGELPARFELRCYYTLPEGWPGPRIVSSAELAYIDAKTCRYRLVRARE
jgi:hypothetical protein